MAKEKFIIEEEVWVYQIEGYEEVPYRMKCYDGYAKGELLDDEGEYPNAPKTIRMEYPTLDEVLSDKGGIAEDILVYRGLYDLDVEDIHYGDIMMYLGNVM